MNERIEQLAAKAGIYGAVDINGNFDNEADVQKFAELIVRECGAYLMSPEFIGRSDLDWSMVLNERFGVEE